MRGSVGGIGVPRVGTSLSRRFSFSVRSKSVAALSHCGLVSFIWPSSAPTIRNSDMPPISATICFQLQPFSRLISRSFSVRSLRFMNGPFACTTALWSFSPRPIVVELMRGCKVRNAGLASIAAITLVLTGCEPASPPDYQPSISEQDRAFGAEQHPALLAEFGGAYRGEEAGYVQRLGEKVAGAAGLGGQCTFTL